jgi:hypothetical protein
MPISMRAARTITKNLAFIDSGPERQYIFFAIPPSAQLLRNPQSEFDFTRSRSRHLLYYGVSGSYLTSSGPEVPFWEVGHGTPSPSRTVSLHCCGRTTRGRVALNPPTA